ncbi:MAG: hypothetical protein MJ246_00580 [Clostridia bacterium]|nr:hypothetical protein [Clostridia bacterium]
MLKKYLLLTLSGLMPFMPALLVLTNSKDAYFSGSFFTIIVVAITAGLISTASVHTKDLFLTWNEYINGIYLIKDYNSNPWKDRSWDYTSASNNTFAHAVISFLYFLAIIVMAQKGSVAGIIVCVVCFLYFAAIAILFFRRSTHLSDSIRECYKYEQSWRNIKKEAKLFTKEMLDAKTGYYSKENLHDQLPLDIRVKIKYDFGEIVGFDDLEEEHQSLIIEQAWSPILRKGLSFRPKRSE